MKNKYLWNRFSIGLVDALWIVAISFVLLSLLASIFLLMLGLTAQLLPYLDMTCQCIIAAVTSAAIFAKLTA